jgi:hypothetical protein
MSAVATLDRLEEPRAGSPFDDRATLEDTILGAWEGLVVEGRCACPVCGGEMGACGPGGACRDCASELG